MYNGRKPVKNRLPHNPARHGNDTGLLKRELLIRLVFHFFKLSINRFISCALISRISISFRRTCLSLLFGV